MGLINAQADIIVDSMGNPAAYQSHPDDMVAAKILMQNCIKACIMLSGVHSRCHKSLKDYLKVAYTMDPD